MSDENIMAQVETVVGKSFTVTFNENASTGYVWQCTNEDPALRVEFKRANDNADPAAAPDMTRMPIGGSSEKTFEVTAMEEGEYIVEFQNKRPFSDEIAETAKIKLIVGPK